MENCSAEASNTLPCGAVMLPLFATIGAIKATTPPVGTLMSPNWVMSPVAWSNLNKPFMKSWSLILAVVASNAPTLICAFLPIIMPFGLEMNTLPLAFIAPSITDFSLPITRFKITACALGCLKLTVSSALMPKDCQLMAAFWLFC